LLATKQRNTVVVSCSESSLASSNKRHIHPRIIGCTPSLSIGGARFRSIAEGIVVVVSLITSFSLESIRRLDLNYLVQSITGIGQTHKNFSPELLYNGVQYGQINLRTFP
jgi:hypothetical protein